MSKCPGLYSDIGKKARDVLYKDFAQQPKMYQIKDNYGWSVDVSCKVKDILPGFSAVFGLVAPQAGMVELQYIQDYFGASVGVGAKQDSARASGISPSLSLSGIVGTKIFKFGSAVTLDAATQDLHAFSAALSFNTDLIFTSLTMENLDILRASFYLTVIPPTSTAIAAEASYSLQSGDPAVGIGARHALFRSTFLKGSVDTSGRAAAQIQQGLWNKLFLGLGGEVNFMDSNSSPCFGLSMALRG